MPLFYGMDIMLASKQYIKHVVQCLTVLFILLWGAPMLAAEQTTSDLRLLIDVSGSMKKNDPQNLRVPAVRLLVGMLPEDTYSGIWTFGHRVSSMLTVSQVNKQWRRKARSAADKIHSRELYTDIEQALRKATRDWSEPDPRVHRNIILLTDGLVDISKDQVKNEASRRRIVEQLLPHIAASGAKIHTIALSSNSDHDLMERLSAATGGWFEQVDDANRLDRLFLRLFEQSTTPNTLPLNGNRFTVDGSISDMTVLAFRYPVDESLSLVTPKGDRFSVRDYPANVRWNRETNYDLVTVENPLPGEWRLDAPEDPDNRVTVVTNLRLEVDPIPAHFAVASAPTLRARLLYDAASANRPDFLDWVQFTLRDTAQRSGEETTIAFWDGGEPPDTNAGDGTHSAQFEDELTPGLHELVVIADGGSFSREYRQMVRVYAHAVDAQIVPEGSEPSNTQSYRLDVKVEPALLQTENLQLQGFLESADRVGIPLTQIDHNKWRLALPEALSGNIVELEVEGLGRGGNPYFLSRRLRIGSKKKPQGKVQVVTAKQNAGVQDDQPPVADSNELDWGMTAVFIIVENLLLGLLIWLGYMLWKRHTATQEMPETEEKAARTAEAADAEAAKSISELATEDPARVQEAQSTADQPTDSSAGNEKENPSNETNVSTVAPSSEKDTAAEDAYTIQELDDDLNATLGAWDEQATGTQFDNDELDADDKTENTESLEENVTNTTTAVDNAIEKDLADSLETSKDQPTLSDSTTDAPVEGRQRGEAIQDETGEQADTESGDTPESEASDADIETLSIDLSDGPEVTEDSGNEAGQTALEEARNADPETQTPQTDDSNADEYAQELLAELQNTEEQQSDPDFNLREGTVDQSETTDKIETTNAEKVVSEQVPSDVDPDAQQKATPEEPQKMAR